MTDQQQGPIRRLSRAWKRIDPFYRPWECADCDEIAYHHSRFTPNYCTACGSDKVSLA